jgi:hypothetical protein
MSSLSDFLISLKYVCSVITISSNFKIWSEKNLIFTVIHLVKSFQHFFLIWCVNCNVNCNTLNESLWTPSHSRLEDTLYSSDKLMTVFDYTYYIITTTFCKWSNASVYTYTITCDGRQDSDYHSPVYLDFWSTCFISVYCHYFQVLTHLT